MPSQLASPFDAMPGIFRDVLANTLVDYTPAATGVPVSLKGIFEAPGRDVRIGGDVVLETQDWTLDVVAADLPCAAAQDDRVTVASPAYRGEGPIPERYGTDYVVQGVLPDGQGMVRLTLTPAA